MMATFPSLPINQSSAVLMLYRTSPVRVAGRVGHEKSLLFTQTGNIHGTSIAGLLWLGLQVDLVTILGKICAFIQTGNRKLFPVSPSQPLLLIYVLTMCCKTSIKSVIPDTV